MPSRSHLPNRVAAVVGRGVVSGVVAGLLMTTGCSVGTPKASPTMGVDELEIPTPSPDPDDFAAEVSNRFLPLIPGSRWTYRLTAADGSRAGTLVATVPEETRTIAGVEATGLREVATIGRGPGRVTVRRTTWLAQDETGNVWTFGAEESRSTKARITSEYAWKAGVDGDRAALAMSQTPRVGDGYAYETGPEERVVRAEVIALDREVDGPDGQVSATVTTMVDSARPGLIEERSYAPGVGLTRTELLPTAARSDEGQADAPLWAEQELIAFTSGR